MMNPGNLLYKLFQSAPYTTAIHRHFAPSCSVFALEEMSERMVEGDVNRVKSFHRFRTVYVVSDPISHFVRPTHSLVVNSTRSQTSNRLSIWGDN